MTDDEMDRESTRHAGEPVGTAAGAMFADDDEPAGEHRQMDDAGSATRAVDEQVSPAGEPLASPPGDPTTSPAGGRAPGPGADGFDVLGDEELTAIRDRWAGLQATFVDDPAGAARQADTMVGEVLDHLRQRHRELHDEEERQHHGGADTEARRVEFLRYRSFFRALLG
jgi:hypothetical protein